MTQIHVPTLRERLDRVRDALTDATEELARVNRALEAEASEHDGD